MGKPQPVAPPAEPPAEPVTQSAIDSIVQGIKNADADALMASLGLPAPTHGQKRTFEVSLDVAKAIMAEEAGRSLTDEQKAEIKALHAEIAKKDEEADKRRAEINRLRSELAISQRHAEEVNDQKSNGRRRRARVSKEVLAKSKADYDDGLALLEREGLIPTGKSKGVLFQAAEDHRPDTLAESETITDATSLKDVT